MKAQDAKRQIIDMIINMSGEVSPYDIYFDWVKYIALSISLMEPTIKKRSEKEEEIYKDRSDQIEKILEKYTPEEHAQEKFNRMGQWLAAALDDNPADCLGEIYMEAELGNKHTGQFFTPFNLSKAMAAVTMTAGDGEVVRIHEPSCGAGGMIIASALALRDKGVDFRAVMDVVAQDLDWKSVYMCYIQMSLLGIKGVVAQGDTIEEPFYPGDDLIRDNVFVTPAKAGISEAVSRIHRMTEMAQIAMIVEGIAQLAEEMAAGCPAGRPAEDRTDPM